MQETYSLAETTVSTVLQ